MTNDLMQGFMFDDMEIRGVHLRLDQGVKALLEQKDYPAPVANLLAEMLIVACLLSANLKLQGRLSVQVRGQGPLKWVMAECRQFSDDPQQPFRVKGMAQVDADIPLNASLEDMVGDSRLVITIEPDQGQRYQGIVMVDQATLAECIESYFYQSEQLPTHIQLVSKGEGVAGFMLQRLPQVEAQEEQADKDWELVHVLAASLSEAELSQLPADQVLHRLFHEHNVKVFSPRKVLQECDCSRKRCGAAITSLGKAAVDEILAEQEAIIIDCQFCNAHYAFDKVDCHVLLEPAAVSDQATDSLH
jgi:molecular chaperone Hsp33